jgi:hypothetical protein
MPRATNWLASLADQRADRRRPSLLLGSAEDRPTVAEFDNDHDDALLAIGR